MNTISLFTFSVTILMCITSCKKEPYIPPHEPEGPIGHWTRMADFGGDERLDAVGFSIGNKGYIGTGHDSGTYYRDLWEWDQSTNAWTQKADFAGGCRVNAVGFAMGSKGYIGTGYDSIGNKNDFWEWDQATNIWTQKANFGGTPRCWSLSFTLGTVAFVGTGYDNVGPRGDFWSWDQVTDIWYPCDSIPGVKMYEGSAFSIGWKGYVCAGATSDTTSRRGLWEFDPSVPNHWRRHNDCPNVVTGAVGFSIGGKGYVGTGAIPGWLGVDISGWIYQWDPATGDWKTSVQGYETYGATAFVIGNSAYIGTGQGEGSNYPVLREFWEFTE